MIVIVSVAYDVGVFYDEISETSIGGWSAIAAAAGLLAGAYAHRLAWQGSTARDTILGVASGIAAALGALGFGVLTETTTGLGLGLLVAAAAYVGLAANVFRREGFPECVDDPVGLRTAPAGRRGVGARRRLDLARDRDRRDGACDRRAGRTCRRIAALAGGILARTGHVNDRRPRSGSAVGDGGRAVTKPRAGVRRVRSERFRARSTSVARAGLARASHAALGSRDRSRAHERAGTPRGLGVHGRRSRAYRRSSCLSRPAAARGTALGCRRDLRRMVTVVSLAFFTPPSHVFTASESPAEALWVLVGCVLALVSLR